MYYKILINLFLMFCLGVIQISFISGLPPFLNGFNLVVVILVFILSLNSMKLAMFWAIGLGLLFDIYSFLPFGVYLLSLSFTVVLIYFLLVNFFTNRSLYTFLTLVLVASIFNEFLIYFFSYFIIFLSREELILNFNINFWKHKIQGLLVNLSAVFLIFYSLSFASPRLKPVFLERYK